LDSFPFEWCCRFIMDFGKFINGFPDLPQRSKIGTS